MTYINNLPPNITNTHHKDVSEPSHKRTLANHRSFSHRSGSQSSSFQSMLEKPENLHNTDTQKIVASTKTISGTSGSQTVSELSGHDSVRQKGETISLLIDLLQQLLQLLQQKLQDSENTANDPPPDPADLDLDAPTTEALTKNLNSVIPGNISIQSIQDTNGDEILSAGDTVKGSIESDKNTTINFSRILNDQDISGLPGPTAEQSDLDAAREKWNNAVKSEINDYEFSISTIRGNGNFRIDPVTGAGSGSEGVDASSFKRVRNVVKPDTNNPIAEPSMHNAFELPNDIPLPNNTSNPLRITVQGLFDLIQSEITKTQDPASDPGGDDEVTVLYNSDFGYPEHILLRVNTIALDQLSGSHTSETLRIFNFDATKIPVGSE